MNIRKVLNPKTNRFVHVGTQKYKRLISEGVIQPVSDPEETITPATAPAAPESLKVKLIETATDVVKENATKFTPELTQEQTDRLLKKMLYEKLCIKPKPSKTKKPKKKKKPKFKVVEPQSSSSDESESESESD
jgi:hypothetical protein